MCDSWVLLLLCDVFWYVIVVLSVNESVYVVIILCGVIVGVLVGEIEVGYVYGMMCM